MQVDSRRKSLLSSLEALYQRDIGAKLERSAFMKDMQRSTSSIQ